MSGYIGTQPVPQATQTRDSFTATSGQTSFATGGYTPNFLDVYLNGVKLASADYTATNGSDVVLASGAATGDILEVVAYTTFTVGSSFTPSIDDNGNATALTIDSSENVLIGKTTDAFGTAGIALRSTVADFTRDSGTPVNVNRLTDDGRLIALHKDSVVVGSIGTDAGIIYAGGGDAFLGFDSTYNLIKPASTSTGGGSDGLLDLGGTTRRFKDAYLSGGVYLGGTGSANKLEDYEEGDFTPTPNSGSYSSAGGKYTKVGRVVTLNFDIYVGSSGAGAFMTLPFSSTTTTSNAIYTSPQNFASGRTAFYGVAAGTTLYFRVTGDNIAYSAQGLDANVVLHASITYQTT